MRKTKHWRAARQLKRKRRYERKKREAHERERGHWKPGPLKPLGLLESRRRQPRLDKIVTFQDVSPVGLAA